MPAVVRLTPEQIPATGEFLRRIFGQPEGFPLFTDQALGWKGFSVHPWHPEPRSYGIFAKEVLAAHGTMVPLRLETGGEEIPAQCLIDWAASASLPGGGILVRRHLATLSAVQVGIGGTDPTRKILARLGFVAWAPFVVYSWIQKPWSFRRREPFTARTIPQLVRDYQRSWPGPAPPVTLAARRVDRFEEPLPVPRAELARAAVSCRSAALLNHILGCPMAAMEGYVIHAAEQVMGYCLLNRKGRDCRVADLWVASGDVALWREAVGLVTALAGPETEQVLGAAATQLEQQAWLSSGYHAGIEIPIAVSDPGGRLTDDAKQLRIGMIDNDGFYI